jgi:hypothetical protein
VTNSWSIALAGGKIVGRVSHNVRRRSDTGAPQRRVLDIDAVRLGRLGDLSRFIWSYVKTWYSQPSCQAKSAATNVSSGTLLR